MRKSASGLAALLCLSCTVSGQQTATDAAGFSTETDPTQECTPYYNVAPFDEMVAIFPPVWQIADILKTDTTAQALYNSILPGIPNIPPRGTPLYAPQPWFANYSKSDPDCWWTYQRCTTPKLAGLPPDLQECSTANTFGLAFDDGPNCTSNAFMSFLRDNNLKSDLFYIGSNLLDWPLQGQVGFNDGHIVCAHTWSHRAMCSLNNTQVFAELYYSMLVIKNVLGVTPRCWRPPFGDVDDRVRYIANALGLQTFMWNENTNDFYVSTLGPAVINANYEEIISLQTNGSYGGIGVAIEAHELNNATMQLFANNYLGIKNAFQHVEPIHACNNITQPYAEPQYTYPNHAQFVAGTSTLMAMTASAAVASSFSTPLSAFVAISGLTTGTYSAYIPPIVTSTPPGAALPSLGVGQPDSSLIVDPTTVPAGVAATATPSGAQAAVVGAQTTTTSSTSEETDKKSAAIRTEPALVSAVLQYGAIVAALLTGAAAVAL